MSDHHRPWADEKDHFAGPDSMRCPWCVGLRTPSPGATYVVIVAGGDRDRFDLFSSPHVAWSFYDRVSESWNATMLCEILICDEFVREAPRRDSALVVERREAVVRASLHRFVITDRLGVSRETTARSLAEVLAASTAGSVAKHVCETDCGGAPDVSVHPLAEALREAGPGCLLRRSGAATIARILRREGWRVPTSSGDRAPSAVDVRRWVSRLSEDETPPTLVHRTERSARRNQ
jgi:hypothetical protein